LKTHKIVAYPFIGKARARYQDFWRENPLFPQLLPGGLIIPHGDAVFVELPLERGTSTYRFTPVVSWGCRMATPQERRQLPALSPAADRVTLTKPAAHLLDRLLKEVAAFAPDDLPASASLSERAVQGIGGFLEMFAFGRGLAEAKAAGDGAHRTGKGHPPGNGAAAPDQHAAF
jgi:hypothetical protein